MNSHNFNKKIIANNFSKAASNYDNEAKIQAHAAAKLCKISSPLIEKINNKKIKIIDLGSGTSAIYKNLVLPNKSVFFEADLSLTMLKKTTNKYSNPIVADIENLPLKKESCDVIISSFALQWLENFEKTFHDFYHVLKKDGILVFSIPTSKSLEKLRKASIDSGCNFHFHELPEIIDIEKKLKKCGFTKEYLKSEILELEFNGTIAALKHLKKIGANYSKEKNFITKKQLQNFDQYYNSSGKFKFLWHISYLILRK
ncbi:MAG: methyltransferase domain-containing protein [Rickettsiales bacterium]|nr:methyltransferase domain-containing protein [Rickettsiales bacterium]